MFQMQKSAIWLGAQLIHTQFNDLIHIDQMSALLLEQKDPRVSVGNQLHKTVIADTIKI